MSVLLGQCAIGADAPPQPVQRTRAQVEAMIAQAGKTPPDWWNSVDPKYPPTLDLTWNNSGTWDNKRNMGQFIWDIIDPNPGRWKEGVKLVHLSLNHLRNNPQKVREATGALARMYAHLLEDFPRAAFWARKNGQDAILLANCYWKMGSKEMASEILNRINGDPTRSCSVIKLWADMGEVDKALRIAEVTGKSRPDGAFLAAGDACRTAGRYAEALKYYERGLVSEAKTQSREGDYKMNHERLLASIAAVRVFDSLDLSKVPDGKYRASSFAYTGPLEVEVTVRNQRIEDVQVTKHTEKQFYSSITDTRGQILEKQGVKGVDATAGATITSEAIINSTAKALAAAMKAQ